MQIKVSVCFIAYNHAKYIEQALESVLMQKTDFLIEIVIGEDNSTDSTKEICEKYQSLYPDKIRIISSDKNIGPQPNFERTYYSCRGKYIAMLEGDDYWTDPLKLQKQVSLLENKPEYVISFHDSIVIDENDNILKQSKITETSKRNLSKEQLIIGTLIPTNTVMFRNGIINRFPKEFLEVTNGDTFLFALLGQYGEAAYQNDIQPAIYRVHGGGVWGPQGKYIKQLKSLKTFELLLAAIEVKYKHLIKKVIFSKRLRLLFIDRGFSDTTKFYINTYTYFYFGKSMYRTWLKSHYDLLKQLFRN